MCRKKKYSEKKYRGSPYGVSECIKKQSRNKKYGCPAKGARTYLKYILNQMSIQLTWNIFKIRYVIKEGSHVSDFPFTNPARILKYIKPINIRFSTSWFALYGQGRSEKNAWCNNLKIISLEKALFSTCRAKHSSYLVSSLCILIFLTWPCNSVITSEDYPFSQY